MIKSKYPYIICHMMSSIEGKITSGENVDILDDYFSLYTKTEDTFNTKAWMCGRVTIQMFALKKQIDLPKASEKFKYESFISKPVSSYYFFGVDTKGKLRWENSVIQFTNINEPLNLVIICTKSTPKNYLSYLKSLGISYLIAGEDEIDFDSLFSQMHSLLKIEKLILEGGGLINGSVLKADFVDEISLMVTPIVVNRTKAPSVFERDKSEELDVKHFSLIDVQKLANDCVWLRYKKKF